MYRLRYIIMHTRKKTIIIIYKERGIIKMEFIKKGLRTFVPIFLIMWVGVNFSHGEAFYDNGYWNYSMVQALVALINDLRTMIVSIVSVILAITYSICFGNIFYFNRKNPDKKKKAWKIICYSSVIWIIIIIVLTILKRIGRFSTNPAM